MKFNVKDIVYVGIVSGLVLVATFINFRLPFVSQGGLVHFGTAVSIIAILVFRTKIGMLAGAIGMGVFDIIGGYLVWAPATIIARLLLGFIFGKIAFCKNSEGNSILLNIIGLIIGGFVMILTYYLYEALIFSNWIVALSSVPGDVLQLIFSMIIGIPIGLFLKKYIKP